MDPLSIIASIAGIATAGTALSKAIYEFISSTKGASREMLDIARTIADLSIILGELRRVLRDGSELCNRKYLRRIKSAIRRISRIHGEIHQLMDGARGFANFKWRLKRSEVQEKLTRIECHKTAINLMLNVLVLAITTRQQIQQSRLSDTQSSKGSQQGQRHQEQDQGQDIYLLRQQSENLAYAAHQSLIELSWSQNQQCDPDLEQPSDVCSDQPNETSSQLQVGTFRQGSDDTGHWLFDLVFSPYSQARIDSNDQTSTDSGIDSAASDVDDHAQEQPSKNRNGSPSRSLLASSPSEMRMALYNPGAAGSVVKELLADWTVLTEKEIESTTGDEHCPEQKEVDASEESQDKSELIFFKDAVGRKFKFPFYKVEKFEGIKRLVESAFRQVDVLGPHVQEGHYDLIGPDDTIILPEVWDDLIRPGMHLTMTMWPMDDWPMKNPTPPDQSSTQPVKPTQSTNPEQASVNPKEQPHKPTTPVPPNTQPLNETGQTEPPKSKKTDGPFVFQPPHVLSRRKAAKEPVSGLDSGRGTGGKKQPRRNKPGDYSGKPINLPSPVVFPRDDEVIWDTTGWEKWQNDSSSDWQPLQ